MTLAGTIRNYLYANWSLTLPARDLVEFHEGWFNSKAGLDAQVTVSDFASPQGHMFAGDGILRVKLYPRFVVNCWYRVARGDLGTLQMELIESMRREVARIITAGWDDVFPSDICIPLDEGRPLHELDATPRILRYEVTLLASRDI